MLCMSSIDLYRESVRKSIVVVVTPLTAIMDDQAS